MNAHLERWLGREFGEPAARRLAPAVAEYYRLVAMRRPEFMGWSQVELPDRKHYPGGLSQVSDTGFSFREFGDEAQRYIDALRWVSDEVSAVRGMIPPRSLDAYFASVYYPVNASRAMAEKMLYAQKARQRAKTTYAPASGRPTA